MARDRTGPELGVFSLILENSTFTCMGIHFWRIKAPNFQAFSDTLFGRSQGHFWLNYFWVVQVSLLEVFWRLLGSFGMSLAPSCESFGCLWLAWAVFGLPLVYIFLCTQGRREGVSQLNFVCYVCVCVFRCNVHFV